MTMNDRERLAALRVSLTNWTPSVETIGMIEDVRASAAELGAELIASTPDSRERSIALTHLEEVVMWGVKAMVLADRAATLEREEIPDAPT